MKLSEAFEQFDLSQAWNKRREMDSIHEESFL